MDKKVNSFINSGHFCQFNSNAFFLIPIPGIESGIELNSHSIPELTPTLMVIAIMQTTSDRLRTVFRLMTDFRQTSDRLQTSDFYFRIWTSARLRTSDLGFWTSDFEFQTSDLRLRTDFELHTSEFELQTFNFRLRVRILDFGYTSDRPRHSDFKLRSFIFRLWTI